MIRCLAVGLGGAGGSIARYGLGMWGASLETRLPWGTFAANALGCLAMGVVMFFVVERQVVPEGWRLAVAVGLLGGLTTFSTFSYEVLALLRQGHGGSATIYLAGSIATGLAAAGAGWWVASLIGTRS
ncbi:MAG: fluoride efflux transporter CrcB [Phycisphaerales bacterium]|nr:fluoride efflux transporter CrcB [Phycisphaerales bacterium]